MCKLRAKLVGKKYNRAVQEAVSEVIASGYGKGRVLNAYFAQKRVSENGTRLGFRSIESSILGKTVYLVVVTKGMRNRDVPLRVSVRAMVRNGQAPDQDMPLMVFDYNRALTNTPVMPYESRPNGVITKDIGDTSDLLQNNGELPTYDNWESCADKVIIKLQLRPANRTGTNSFNTWAERISALDNGRMYLEIDVRSANDGELLYYRDEQTPRPYGRFIGGGSHRFYIENKSFFKTYHGQNNYNFLSMNGTQRRKVARLQNNNSNQQVVFFYYDMYDNEHLIREATVRNVIKWRRLHTTPSVDNLRAISDGNTTRYYQGQQIRYYRFTKRNGGQVTYRYWEPDGNETTESITLGIENQTYEDGRDYIIDYNRDGIVIMLVINDSRRYLNPIAYACLIGVLAQCAYTDVTCNGFTCIDGIGVPSVSHENGINADFRYLRQDGRIEACHLNNSNYRCDYNRQKVFIDAVRNYGWMQAVSYNFSDRNVTRRDYDLNVNVSAPLFEHREVGFENSPYRLRNTRHLVDHHHHLHIEGFNGNILEIIV